MKHGFGVQGFTKVLGFGVRSLGLRGVFNELGLRYRDQDIVD